MNSEEVVFVRKALEGVEKAQKIHRVKQIVATVLLIAWAVWLAFQPSLLPNNGAYTVMIFVGVFLVACTTKIVSLINKNTISVLPLLRTCSGGSVCYAPFGFIPDSAFGFAGILTLPRTRSQSPGRRLQRMRGNPGPS